NASHHAWCLGSRRQASVASNTKKKCSTPRGTVSGQRRHDRNSSVISGTFGGIVSRSFFFHVSIVRLARKACSLFSGTSADAHRNDSPASLYRPSVVSNQR